MEEEAKKGPDVNRGLPPDAAGLKPIIIIGMDKDEKLMVVGPFDKKEYCIALLADTIKFALTVAPPAVPTQPEKSKIIV